MNLTTEGIKLFLILVIWLLYGFIPFAVVILWSLGKVRK